MGEVLSIEIYIGFIYVDAGFIILHIKKSSRFKSEFDCHSVGILFIVIGNYFKVIQPNYFIGIKTPWTWRIKKFGN
jgi:uncharacterized membrane protein